MYPAIGIAGNSYVLRAPHSKKVKGRTSVSSTNLTVANAYADGIPLDMKSDLAAIAATCSLLHLDPLSFSISRLEIILGQHRLSPFRHRRSDFSSHLTCWFVGPKPDEDSVAQQSVAGPGQVGDFGDELRLDPMNARQYER